MQLDSLFSAAEEEESGQNGYDHNRDEPERNSSDVRARNQFEGHCEQRVQAARGSVESTSGPQPPTSRPQEPAESSTNKSINRDNKRRHKNHHKRYRPYTTVGRILSVHVTWVYRMVEIMTFPLVLLNIII